MTLNINWKYFGILESDAIKKKKIKTRKIWEVRWNRNLIKGRYSWRAPIARYSAPFQNWTKEELKTDHRTRLVMHKALHYRYNVGKL